MYLMSNKLRIIILKKSKLIKFLITQVQFKNLQFIIIVHYIFNIKLQSLFYTKFILFFKKISVKIKIFVSNINKTVILYLKQRIFVHFIFIFKIFYLYKFFSIISQYFAKCKSYIAKLC